MKINGSLRPKKMYSSKSNKASRTSRASKKYRCSKPSTLPTIPEERILTIQRASAGSISIEIRDSDSIDIEPRLAFNEHLMSPDEAASIYIDMHHSNMMIISQSGIEESKPNDYFYCVVLLLIVLLIVLITISILTHYNNM